MSRPIFMARMDPTMAVNLERAVDEAGLVGSVSNEMNIRDLAENMHHTEYLGLQDVVLVIATMKVGDLDGVAHHRIFSTWHHGVVAKGGYQIWNIEHKIYFS